MRLLVLFLALAASACQGRNLSDRSRSVEAREQELMSLDAKRKDAIFDLSNDPKLNPRR